MFLIVHFFFLLKMRSLRLLSRATALRSVRSSALTVVPSKPMYNQVVSNLESVQISSDLAKHDDVFPFSIKGNEAQIIEIYLAPGEGVRAEVGSLVYFEDGIEMETSTGGGVMKSFKRWVTGDTFFITDFVNNQTEEKVCPFFFYFFADNH